mgnify:CR=1 FL=1
MNLAIAIPRDEDVAKSDNVYAEKWRARQALLRAEERWIIMSYQPWENIWWDSKYGYGSGEKINLTKSDMTLHIVKQFDIFRDSKTATDRAKTAINMFSYIHTYFSHFKEHFMNDIQLLDSIYKKTNEFRRDRYDTDKKVMNRLHSICTDLSSKIKPLLHERARPPC